MSFVSVEFRVAYNASRFDVHIVDTTFKETFDTPRGLSIGKGYGLILKLYQKKKMPLASNFALMARSVYKTTSTGQVKFMSDQINQYFHNLITPEILNCALKFLKEQ